MKKTGTILISAALTVLFSTAYADSANHYATEQNVLNQIYNNVGTSSNAATPPAYSEAGVAMVEGRFSGALANAQNNANTSNAPALQVAAPVSNKPAVQQPTQPQTTSSVATGFGN